MIEKMREVSPTAGLPLKLSDFYQSNHLEEKLSDFFGVPDVQIESSGTASLVVALNAIKQMSSRRSVVISAYTCPWVPLAVLHCGLKPVLCDTLRGHFDMCQSSLNSVVDQDTLAVIPTHLAGRVSDIQKIIEIAHAAGAYVIEDSAQALGAKFKGVSTGTLGDIGFYSLGVGKGLTIFAGGVLVARESFMREALRKSSDEVVQRKIWWEIRRILELIGYYLFYRPYGLAWVYGYNLRRLLSEGKLIEAVGDNCTPDFPIHLVSRYRKSVGSGAFERLAAFNAESRILALKRIAELNKIPRIEVIQDSPESIGVWPFIIVLMPTEESRDNALAELWDQGLGVGRLFIHAICEYDYLSEFFNGIETPNAIDFAKRSMTISNSSWLKDMDFIKILKTLKEQSSHV